MTRTVTTAALAAKAIRAELKEHFPSIKFKVRSENYTGGNSVNIDTNDLHPSVISKIKLLVAKYQYGSFDSMNDIYEYTNCNDNIPQVKYLFVNNPMSDEMRTTMYAHITGYYDVACYENGVDRFAHRLYHNEDSSFWKSLAA